MCASNVFGNSEAGLSMYSNVCMYILSMYSNVSIY